MITSSAAYERTIRPHVHNNSTLKRGQDALRSRLFAFSPVSSSFEMNTSKGFLLEKHRALTSGALKLMPPPNKKADERREMSSKPTASMNDENSCQSFHLAIGKLGAISILPSETNAIVGGAGGERQHSNMADRLEIVKEAVDNDSDDKLE